MKGSSAWEGKACKIPFPILSSPPDGSAHPPRAGARHCASLPLPPPNSPVPRGMTAELRPCMCVPIPGGWGWPGTLGFTHPTPTHTNTPAHSFLSDGLNFSLSEVFS